MSSSVSAAASSRCRQRCRQAESLCVVLRVESDDASLHALSFRAPPASSRKSFADFRSAWRLLLHANVGEYEATSRGQRRHLRRDIIETYHRSTQAEPSRRRHKVLARGSRQGGPRPALRTHGTRLRERGCRPRLAAASCRARGAVAPPLPLPLPLARAAAAAAGAAVRIVVHPHPKPRRAPHQPTPVRLQPRCGKRSRHHLTRVFK